MDDLKDFLLFTVCLILLFVAIACIGIGGASFVERYQCTQYQEATGKATKYQGLECYVQDGGAWYAWSEYKNRLITKGELK